MRYASTLVAVKNMDISKRFYRDVSGLQVTADFGANVTLEGGVILQTMDARQSFTRTGQVFLSNIFGELYFEKEGKSSSSGRDCFYIFYRVGSMSVSCLCTDEASGWLRRFIQGELSPEEAAERKDIPLEFVLSALTVRGSVS